MAETRFSIEGQEFFVSGIVVHMPTEWTGTGSALPMVMMDEESATQLCLELAYQLKLKRDQERDDEEIRAASYEEWLLGLSQSEYRAHLAQNQKVANQIRAEQGLPPLDPPDSTTGFQKR